MEYWEEILKRYKKDYGEKLVEECGINYIAQAYPERAKYMMDEMGFNFDHSSIPRKYLEIIMFGACIALGDPRGAKLHAAGALKAGATKEMLLDYMYVAGVAASHACSVNSVKQLQPVLEAGMTKLTNVHEKVEPDKLEAWKEVIEGGLKLFIERRDELPEAHKGTWHEYLHEVYPERVGFFYHEVTFDDTRLIPLKYHELTIFGVCIAERNTRGSWYHINRCLHVGATPREILDVLFAVAACASHNCVANILNELKPALEAAK